jgi:hypothetical protein
MSPYSMAVTPSSFLRKSIIFFILFLLSGTD